jgi:hypothetical protein
MQETKSSKKHLPVVWYNQLCIPAQSQLYCEGSISPEHTCSPPIRHVVYWGLRNQRPEGWRGRIRSLPCPSSRTVWFVMYSVASGPGMGRSCRSLTVSVFCSFAFPYCTSARKGGETSLTPKWIVTLWTETTTTNQRPHTLKRPSRWLSVMAPPTN